MAAVTVSVGLDKVEAGVKTISAKVGLKADDWAKALKAEDDNIIESYMAEGAYVLLDAMGHYCTGMRKTEDHYVFALDMPTNWSSTARKLGGLMEQYFINFVCSRWFSIVLPEQSGLYDTNASKYAAIVFKELIMRGKPLRS